MPLHNKRKRRRVDDTESCSTRDDKAVTQADDGVYQDDDGFSQNDDGFSQDDADSSQDDEDFLRKHKRIFLDKSIPQDDHEAAEGPGETYRNMFRSLEHMWLRLRQLGESLPSSRNTSDEDAEKLGTLAKEMEILHARIGQMEQKAGIQYCFKGRGEVMALKMERPSYPFICLAAECKKYYKRQDRLHQHIRKKDSAEHRFLSSIISNTLCYQCCRSFSPSNLTVHARKEHGETLPKLELFQDLIASMNQDFDPHRCGSDTLNAYHEAEHREASVMGGKSPSSSLCSDTALDAHSVQAQKEQHTLAPKWNDSDFTVAHALNSQWTDSDFTVAHALNSQWTDSDFTVAHTLAPQWTDSELVWMGSGSFAAYSMDLLSPHQTDLEPAPSSSDFVDTDIHGPAEAGHTDNRPFERQYDSSGAQYASGHNPSQTDLSWTSYAEQATIQGLQGNQHPVLGSSQIVQTQTVSSQSFGNKTLNAAEELAAAKAEQATWEEVMCIRERTENLKRIVQAGSRTQNPIVQGVGIHSSQQLETLMVHPHQQIGCV